MSDIHPITEKVAEAIAEERAARDRARAREHLIRVAARTIGRILVELDVPSDDLSISLPSCGCWGTIQGPIVSIHAVKNVREQITPILRELARRGWHSKSSPEWYDKIRRIRWTLRHEGHETPVTINAFLPYEDDEDASCRLVQVGEKTEPVYEVRCNGESLDELTPAVEVEPVPVTS